jgi:hypothetical protein
MKPKPTQGSEIERLFYTEKCYTPLFESLYVWVAEHFSAMELHYARIKFPDAAMLQSMMLKFATDIAVVEDTISFDAVVACEVELQQDGRSCSHDQWFRLSCEVVVEDKIKRADAKNIQVYERTKQKNKIGKADVNLVPIMGWASLDAEATRFLERYCPEALEQPMAVPIAAIVEENMNLQLLMSGRLSSDFSAFGQICFSKGTVDIYDAWEGTVTPTAVERGTIIIDNGTFWERNLGCVNNTIAHEAFHWHRHRVYAAAHSILNGEKFIAQRCPSKSAHSYSNDEKAEWSDVDKMEWQANHVAPRILMPYQTVKPYIESLYDLHAFRTNVAARHVILECVIDELADTYKVSKQSAKIRMLDLGYSEAAEVYNFDDAASVPYFNSISARDAFYEYCDNDEFRKIIDLGLFVFVGGHFVINNEKYVTVDQNGEYSLTTYAYNNFSECTLQFTYRRVNMRSHRKFHDDIFHRENVSAITQLPHYDAGRNYPVYETAKDLASKVAEFNAQYETHKEESLTFWEQAYQMMKKRKWNSSIFCDRTLLNEMTYSRCKTNYDSIPDIRTVMAIAVGLDLDIGLTTHLLALAGHALSNSREHQAYSYIITGYKGRSIHDRNEFLISQELTPLGSKQRI